MYRIIELFIAVLKAVFLFVASPIAVIWNVIRLKEHYSYILHFYLWAIGQFVGIYFLKHGGESGLALILLAIIKEEVIDGLIGMGTKDYKDLWWSFKGVVWISLLYLIILNQVL